MFPLSSFAVVENKLCCFALSGKNFIQKIHSSPIHNKGTHFEQGGLCFLSKQYPSRELTQHHSACFCLPSHRQQFQDFNCSPVFHKIGICLTVSSKRKGISWPLCSMFQADLHVSSCTSPFTTPPRCHMAEDLQKKKGGSIPVNPKFLEWSLVLQR